MLKVSEVRAGYGQTVILQDMSLHIYFFLYPKKRQMLYLYLVLKEIL